MTLKIRPETSSDIPLIHALTRAAFLDAPHTAHTEHFIVDALRKAGALTLSLVAEEDGMILGHVAISPVSISNGVSGWYGLGPISVSPQRQGQGIGSRLMLEVLQQLKDMEAGGCVLVGDPAFYARFGFKADPGLVYPGIPPEYFQVLCFTPPIPRATVTFHEAFNTQSGQSL